jgi:SPP1 gp7 family putative phage head morphogenesis protein
MPDLTNKPIKIQRFHVSALKNKPKKRSKTWLFPQNLERQYKSDLTQLCFSLSGLIKQILLPEVPIFAEEVNKKTPNDRQDAFLDRLGAIIIQIRKKINPKIESTILQSLQLANQVNSFNYNQFQKVTESALGVNLFVDEPWLQDQLKIFAAQNSQLITSLADQELERVASIIERSLQQGSSIKNITDQIQKSFGINRRRATLIARDQTTKLNSNLTRLRQQEVGVEEYVWQTAGDERVRPSHKANDGKTFRWDKPPKTGHPSFEINCRCVALPVLEGLLNFT